MTPVSPPSTKTPKNPSRNHVDAVRRTVPLANVAIHANTWIAAGIATTMLAAEKNSVDAGDMPTANM